MANRFEKAASKEKHRAGGELPEELTAGMGQVQQAPVNPPVAEEKTAEAAPEAPAPIVAEAPGAQAAEPAAPVQEEKPNDLVAIYKTKMGAEPEPRNIRLQAVITPTLNNKLNELVTTGAIKSRNDLINFLLERYFKELDS